MVPMDMAVILMDGNKLAAYLRSQVQEEIHKSGIRPGLATILVGKDPASELYVHLKLKACGTVGIKGELFHLPPDVCESEVLKLISSLNSRKDIHGILVQLPLPKHMDTYAILNAIDVSKDVDGLHSTTLGELIKGNERFASCTPKAVLYLLEHYNIALEAKKVVVVGASIEVGKPLAIMLLNRAATVSICHRKTLNLEEYTKSADIVISCTGVPALITKEKIKSGAVLIDVGIAKVNGQVCGDIHPDTQKIASHVSPVPGGVGPVTVAMLLHNTVLAAIGCKDNVRMKHI